MPEEYLLPGVSIVKVKPGSPAALAGIRPGDRLLAVNGRMVTDLVEYRYRVAGERVTLRVLQASGVRDLKLSKQYDQDPGLEFASDVFDGVRTCRNRCLFCFIDQMPPSLRPTLYVKDDDYRLSFLHGNFITLTNLTPKDWKRISRWRLSPLYISVHTTDPDRRALMMGNPGARRIMSHLRRLARAGVEMHIQVVLCPGLNDGEQLERTVTDLSSLWPLVRSVGVVPVGLTGYREGLPSLREPGEDEARRLVQRARAWQASFKRELGSPFVFLADEFYLRAGVDFPPARHYDGFPQLENGIGMARLFLDQFSRAARQLPSALPVKRRVTLATGVAAAPLLRPVVQRLSRVEGLEVSLVAVENRLFGPSVTVAGLLGGADLLCSLQNCSPGDEVWIPQSMLRQGEMVFLDGWQLEDLRRRLGVTVLALPVHGAEPVRRVMAMGGLRE